MFCTVELALPRRLAMSSYPRLNCSCRRSMLTACSRGRKVDALDVLDQGDFQLFQLLVAADDGRDFFEAGQLGGAPAAFAGYQYVRAF